jgi:hypothetical protein
MLKLRLLLELLAGLLRGPASSPGRIGRPGFARIQSGMTEVEVWELLGGPPGDYTGGRWVPRGRPCSGPPPRLWVGQTLAIRVWLDEAEGRVIGKEIVDVQRAPTGLPPPRRRWRRG